MENSLCLDVGNSNIYAGVVDGDGGLVLRFRKTSTISSSADEYGVFLRAALRENGIDPSSIGRIALSSVVPDTTFSIRRACQKYFGMEPFVLQAGVKTGLQIAYKNPLDVGADRIANAVGAIARYPDRDIIVVDMGTATTVDAIEGGKKYIGGSILPGLRISVEALEEKTAKLPIVEIAIPEHACGRSTTESIQAGIYWGHYGAIRELVSRMSAECFSGTKPVVLGTGGFSQLFADAGIFDELVPDLVLEGIYRALLLNPEGRAL